MKTGKIDYVPMDLDKSSFDLRSHPIIVSEKELSRWEKNGKGKLLCHHIWDERLAVPLGGFEIVRKDRIDMCNFPAGRFCVKCGKVDLTHSEGATEEWSQGDFTD